MVWLVLGLLYSEGDWSYSEHGNDWPRQKLGLCGTKEAKEQSPVNFGAEYPPVDPPLFMYYRYPPLGEPVPILNNGKGITFTIPGTWTGGFGTGLGLGHAITGDSLYRLWQVSFHSPSEHMIEGIRFPLEAQLVHKHSESEHLAIISTFFEANSDSLSTFLEMAIGSGLPQQAWDETMGNSHPPVASRTIAEEQDPRFMELLGGATNFIRYDGSLTVPPCEEGVTYYVRQSTVKASADQLEAFRNVIFRLTPFREPGNYRYASPMGSREPVTMCAKNYFNRSETAALSCGEVEAEERDAVTPAPAVSPDELATGEKYSTVLANDTAATAKMKVNLKMGAQDCQAAQAAVRELKKRYDEVKVAYKSSPGVLEKIDLLWEKVATKNAATSAEAQATSSCGIYKKILAKAAKLFTTPDPNAPPPPTPLDYGIKEVTLPSGRDGSPFPATTVETVAESGTRTEVRFLKPTLKQADGPAGVTGDATLAAARGEKPLVSASDASSTAARLSFWLTKDMTPEEQQAASSSMTRQLEANTTITVQDLLQTRRAKKRVVRKHGR
mmetsp:Transcript_42749/g.112650  ORF Transcript_42749/g.112650 Transcript_42749/m.112650 type:complete len:555 (-) Transcript_42749:29-1693(-)